MIKIDGKTQLIGLLGWPVSHSKSPLMHNAVSVAEMQNLVYLPLPVHPDAIGDAFRGLPALGFLGVNVTVPHKQAVMPFLDVIDPAAKAIGAVNTIIFSSQSDSPEGSYEPTSKGFNTDWVGFRDDLLNIGVEFAGRDSLVLGAGGSARAIVYALLEEKSKVYLLARRVDQAVSLIADMKVHFPEGDIKPYALDQLEPVLDHVESPLIINTTPVGMHPKIEASVWPEACLFPSGSFVYDLVYTPAETRLMSQAKAAGCEAANGLGMLLGQGAEAYKIWTGIKPNLLIMKTAL